jgi:hypothetical protein|tara:strand:+ start:113 stop:337 length:225 start_codon:yes stop_codon:yes gene_type:complete
MEQMICGAVYEVKETNRVRQGTLVGVTFENNNTVGAVQFAGHAPELVQHGSERWNMFKMIGRPASPKVGRPKKG